jgi:serine phosphatase RsbU (regulator of sigma subunit)
MVAIGDVTGKGFEAAALTSLVRHNLRAMSEFVSSPAQLLARLDLVLKKQREGSTCTAILLRLDEDGATLAMGGHPLPIRITSGGAEHVGDFGPMLGAFEGVAWRDTTLALPPGSILVMYTDGVTDAVGIDGERYGLSRLRDTLDACRDSTATKVVKSLNEALASFQVGDHADDTAILAIRHSPEADQSVREQEAPVRRATEAVAGSA